MMDRWSSTFSLCKDERHAEAWKGLIEVLRQRQQHPLWLHFEHPVLEEFCQEQLRSRYQCVLAFKLLIFVPLFLADLTHDLAHLSLYYTPFGTTLRNDTPPPGFATWDGIARLSLIGLMELVPAAIAVVLGVCLARAIEKRGSMQYKAWLWSALVVVHVGYVGSRGLVLGDSMALWKQDEHVQEAVTCLLLATMVNDTGFVRTLLTVATIMTIFGVRSAILYWAGTKDKPLVGVHALLKTALAVLVVVFQSESVVREHFRKTALVQHEISMSKTVLRNLLPRHIIRLLVQSVDEVSVTPPVDKFQSVTILFADIVSFTAMSSKLTPQQLVDMLNEIFSLFDRLAMKNKVYKVETIGDCYFCATGMPEADEEHADNMLRMAVDMQEAAKSFVSPTGDNVRFRIGMASGPVVAGVVGHRMPRYHLFGKTINKAESMEQGGEASRVLVSTSTYSLLSESGRALLRSYGRVEDEAAEDG